MFVTLKLKHVHWEKIPDIIQAHHIVRNSGLPNFMYARIPVKNQLRVENWKKHLAQYWDKQLVDLIAFGFLLDYDRTKNLCATEQNHQSALDYLDHVQKYIDTEVNFNAMYGPFQEKPFNMHISPLLTREKQNSENRRVIMDLSWPKENSVNAGVQQDVYLGNILT